MPDRFLFVVPARLGDAIMLTPALALLKQLQPLASIDVLALSALAASVYENNPNSNAIHNADKVRHLDTLAKNYDLLICAHKDFKVMEVIERCRRPVLLIEPNDEQQSRPQQALNFIQAMFCEQAQDARAIAYQLFPDEADARYVRSFFDEDKRYIGLHLGCHGLNKSSRFSLFGKKKHHPKVWPLQHFVQLAQQIRLQYADCQFAITGGDNEHHMAAEFMRQVPGTISLTGKTSVLQLAAAMRHFSLYISSDTGALHVACAMNIPLVAMFLPVFSKRSAPYPSASYRRAMQAEDLANISPQQILAAVNEILPAA